MNFKVTGYGFGERDSIPDRGKYFPFRYHFRILWTHTDIHRIGTGISFLWS